MTKPFRFGVQIANATRPRRWRDKARKLEDLGYSTLFMPDHFGDTSSRRCRRSRWRPRTRRR